MNRRHIWIFLAFMALTLGDQSRLFPSQGPAKILEMFTDNSGLYFPAGRLLYVTVFSDGTLDYMERGDKEMVVRHRHLTSKQMKRLRILLNTRGVVEPSGVLVAEGNAHDRDYQTNLEVFIQRADLTQVFTLQGFSPDLGRPFPHDLAELTCFVDGNLGTDGMFTRVPSNPRT